MSGHSADIYDGSAAVRANFKDLLCDLTKLYKNRSDGDIVLKVKDRNIVAHKLILGGNCNII